MFGNLFGDEDEPSKVGQGAASPLSATPLPPAPRGATKLAGIQNQGSTCFLNVLLQCFSYLPEFREAMFGLSPTDLGFFEKKQKRRVIPIELQKLLASLMLEQQQAVSTKQVTASFGWNEEVIQQHDVNELFSVLFPALIQSLQGISGHSIVRDLVHITTVQKIACEGCGNVTERELVELTLFLQVKGIPSGVEASLNHSFCTIERMAGENQYKCDICVSHQDAQKVIKIRKLPPLLMMTLNRFAYDNRYRQYKVIDQFPFPMELNMGAYMENGQSDPEMAYELCIVIVHKGGMRAGHYTACIRDIDNLGHWEMPDEKVEMAPYEQARPDDVDNTSARQVVAITLSKLLKKSKRVTIDKLSAELGKQTGMPWTKQYKRRYGPFPKFLKDNPDIFSVEDNLVTLVDRPQIRESTVASNAVNIENDGCTGDSATLKQFPEKANESRPGHNWFLFDDSDVKPMHASELSNQFGGQESAYILIYRRKTAVRPLEAFGNPAYCIPEHLMTIITEKNEELHRLREEYEKQHREKKEEEERMKKEVEIEIRYHFNCSVENGMLSPDNSSVPGCFPKTMTFGELKDFISSCSSGYLQERQFHVHRMKFWDGKTHLYEEFTGDDKTLDELSIDNGTILFAWDGHQVAGIEIPTGAECEPLLLHLKEFLSDCTHTHAFPKNLTLREFQMKVSQLTCIPVDSRLRLQFPNIALNGDLRKQSDLETLESIQLEDNACILYDGANSESFSVDLCSFHKQTSESTTQNGRISVRIENLCDQASAVRKLDIDTNMTVGHVIDLFMTTFSIQCDSPVLQQILPSGEIQPPYNDTLSIEDAGITAKTYLVFNRLKMDLQVKFYPEQFVGQDPMKISIRSYCTVSQCMAHVAEVAGLDEPHDWHLCTSNFMFDRLGVLDDPKQILDPSFQYLLLEHGRLMPKDHISLPLWWYPCPNSPWNSQENSLKIEELLISDSQQMSPPKPIYLKDVELHKDTKLETLLELAVGLLAQHQCCVSSTHLRLRLIGGNQSRLRRVLRDPLTTLRRLKLENKMPIGVQINNQFTNLCKKEIVLNINFKKPDDKSYFPPRELLWDTRLGASASKLKQDIAKMMGRDQPEDMLVIAKHIPEEFRWKILTDEFQDTPPNRNLVGGRHGRRRPAGTKPNICQKPFYVDDGDDIGVIFHQEAAVEEDFCTWMDELGRHRLEEEIRRKQQERQGRGLNGLSFPERRRIEVPLKIQVQDYS